MKKQEFIKTLVEALELEADQVVNEDSELKGLINSLGVLIIIALCDESFSKELASEEMKSITTVKSLMEIIGMENFEN